jgi:hypothetical protein
MKTLTTLTAVAALIAGISLAAAQTSTAPKSGAMGSSSSMGAQQQATGSGKFCLEGAPGGALNCKYASITDCQKDAKDGQKCSANPNSGTTGSKQ